MDFEEFVPPIPPPPYYPPEYTCSSETDAQRYYKDLTRIFFDQRNQLILCEQLYHVVPSPSITYNGSMESPIPLYPTDCPPPYEAVMGQRAVSQVSVFLCTFVRPFCEYFFA